MKGINEQVIENTIIAKLVELGYVHSTPLKSAEHEWVVERKLDTFINEGLLFERLQKINNGIRDAVLIEAINTIKRLDSPSLYARNFTFHEYLIGGVGVEDPQAKSNPTIKLIDFDNISNNSFEVVNQLKFNEGVQSRIPDIVIYINGIPLIVFELKSSEVREHSDNSEGTSLNQAYAQLGGGGEKNGIRYDIPSLFNYNSFLVLSDGVNSKLGTLTADYSRFAEWKSVDGEVGFASDYAYKLNVLIKGVLAKERLLDILRYHLFFEQKDKESPKKILTQYHQYFGVRKAHDSILNSLRPDGDGKAGIFWHTQGSGKSYSMLMLAYRLIQDEALKKPTIVILTDRNDLDNQLFGTFSKASAYLRQTPVRADSKDGREVDGMKGLIELLEKQVEGGIIFTTIQKFDKDKTFRNNRSNIIVFSDEAHRSHYGIDEKLIIKKVGDEITIDSYFGMEKYIRDALPSATFIGFTGTPVNTSDKQTAAIFGNIIDTYDMTQSIEDGSTVKLFYESRLAKVWADDKVLKQIDDYYEDLQIQGAGEAVIQASQEKLTKLEIIFGNEDRLRLVANDIYEHYTGRKNFLNSKAMIVCMSRKIALALKKLLVDIDPSLEDIIALCVTNSNKDTVDEREAFGTKKDRDDLAEDFKSKTSKKKIAIVVDMWLTGFDVPDLDVMYIDKKMQGHNLMQAIARVNRVFPGKESGLIVDYAGIRKSLDKALSEYTSRDRGNLSDIQKTAKGLIDEFLSVLNEMFYKVEKAGFEDDSDEVRFKAVQNGAQFVLDSNNRKSDFLKTTKSLKQAYIVANAILDEKTKTRILYYVAIRHYILKLEYEGNEKFDISKINQHIEDLIAEAIRGDEIKVLGITSEDRDEVKLWDLLSKDKLEELRKNCPPHIFIKIMEKLLKEAVQEFKRYNLIKSNEYSEKLRRLLEVYNTREDASAINKTIESLVDFAGEMVQDEENANKNQLRGRERAFYDALIAESSAEEMMKDGILFQIAKELQAIVEQYGMVDWYKKVSTRAKMRVEIKKLLKKYKYPPQYTETAVERVIKQAEYMM